MLNKKLIYSIGLSLIAGSAMAKTGHNASVRYHSFAPKAQVVKSEPDTATRYTLGQSVTTSPYLGIRSAHDGSDLIVNLPTMNEDLRILKQRQRLKNSMGHSPCAQRPLVEISGDVIGQMYYTETFQDSSRHDIDLTGARFDVLGEVSDWAFGYISMNYDNGRVASLLPGSGVRLKNSRFFLKRGFLTIGDLDCSPVYFSLGQMFVPFGRYSSGTISGTLTSAVGRTNARAALLGYYQNNLFASVYAYRGDSHVGDSGVNSWGLNVGYDIDNCYGVSGQVGAGYIANIADSLGMQSPSYYKGFRGFGFSSETEQLVHRVPGYNLHTNLSYDWFSGLVEFVGTTRSFAAADMSFNDSGARVNALHVEFKARPVFAEQKFNVALAYGRTWEALALDLPKHSYIAAVSTSFWKNTIESVEYRHDVNYDASSRAGGNGSDPNPEFSTGGKRNSVIGEIGVYF